MQENICRELLDHLYEMAAVFAEDGTILYMNRTGMNFLEIDSFEGMNITEIFHSEILLDHQKVIIEKQYFQEMVIWNAYRSNKTCFPLKATLRKQDDLYYLTGYDQTIESLLEKENAHIREEMTEVSKMKSEFVANVTHELRTPVNGIAGNTKELQKMEIDPKKLRLMGLILQGCDNMNALINNILDFSKLDAGKLTIEQREFAFDKLIDYIKSNHKNRMAEKGLDFAVSVSHEVPNRIIGDELRIGQILNNLLSNAYKFTSVGKVMLEVAKTAQTDNKVELFFLVIDTGIGISISDREKLFKSFSQVDASITRNYGGTGLGLSISKMLIEQMNGTIQVQSEPGKGTTFSFNIWVEVPEEEAKKTTSNSDMDEIMRKLEANMAAVSENVAVFGANENLEEIKKKLGKLKLCVEMENWMKAETFMEAIKDLTKDGSKEVKSAVLRLKMAVQKEDYEKYSDALAQLETLLKDYSIDG